MRKVVGYLEGNFLLLQNCSVTPMDTMGLLNDVMSLANYQDFTNYIKCISYASKGTNIVHGYEYLNLAKS